MLADVQLPAGHYGRHYLSNGTKPTATDDLHDRMLGSHHIAQLEVLTGPGTPVLRNPLQGGAAVGSRRRTRA